ncbi:MAG: hypothetical protein AB1505_26665 [Candidatus Latescibacterota bacterium]
MAAADRLPQPAALLLLLLLAAGPGAAQDRVLMWGLSGTAPREDLYPRYELEFERPEMHKWYEPSNLVESYVRPWYITDMDYARQYYRTYVSQALEGFDWYDTFGRRLGRGFFVYSWQQQQEQRNGSVLTRAQDLTSPEARRGSLTLDPAIVSDSGPYGTYRLTVGSSLYTVLTPLTFYKSAFNGLRLDWAGDRHAGTLLLSRGSRPYTGKQTNMTHVAAAHAAFEVAPAARLGLTYVNGHNVLTERGFTYGNPLHGSLTSDQGRTLGKVWVRIRDDSPEDEEGGPRVLSHEIVLVDTAGRTLRGRDIGFFPKVDGGRQRDGALVADGGETIVLEYDLALLDSAAAEAADLHRLWVELAIANDYAVELASDLQTNGEKRKPEIVFLPAARARGNVQDESNGRLLRLDYGLPTATEILGVDWDLVEWKGVSVQGEAALNRRFRIYPSADEAHRPVLVDQAPAAYLNAAYNRHPWGLFLEAFSLAHDYTTSYWITEDNGVIRYKWPLPRLYEFVDDDDDHDAKPEWTRSDALGLSIGGDTMAIPGYDENADQRYDHNQNGNLVPDYEEPFLRFSSDRPEFLFGLDLNHNGTIDRLENDNLADYPYRTDHRGYNAYFSARVGPDLRLVLGRQRVRLMAGDGRTRSHYALATGVWHLTGGHRVRLAQYAARVRDDIPDPLEMWVQPVNAIGRMRAVPDLLPARNTDESVLYADVEQRLGPGLRLLHRGRWEVRHQRDRRADLVEREGRRWSGFAGLIDKAEWILPVGLGTLEPRFKSEWRRDRPYTRRQSRASSLEETASLVWRQPLLQERTRVSYFARYGRQLFDTEVRLGLEASRFWMLSGEREEVDQDMESWTAVVELTNRVGYQGYQLVTQAGAQVGWRSFQRAPDQRTSLLFVTLYASLK